MSSPQSAFDIRVEQPKTDQHSLYAASKVIGVDCGMQNANFMRCKQKTSNPKYCQQEGLKVTSCVLKVMRIMQERTPEEFEAHRVCLKEHRREFTYCRETQEALHSAYASIGGFNTRAPLAADVAAETAAAATDA